MPMEEKLELNQKADYIMERMSHRGGEAMGRYNRIMKFKQDEMPNYQKDWRAMVKGGNQLR